MISATGNDPRRGFSLVELIIVIALIALIGGLVAMNAEAILRGLGEEPVDRVLRKAVREARYQAAALKEPTTLRFDEETATFIVNDAAGAELAAFSTGMDDRPGALLIDFEQLLPAQGLSPYTRPETVAIGQVTFRPDRSSTPFQVVVDLENGRFTQRFDPFSDIVIDDSRTP